MSALLEQLTPKIDALLAQDGRAVVAIDGNSGAGKSTLGAALAAHYGDAARLFHADDYFLQPFQRTPERLREPGGNFDRERFCEEISRPASLFADVSYRRLDCSTGHLCEPVLAPFRPLTVVEGSYCLHPALSKYYSLSICLCIGESLQRKRILVRNKNLADRFFSEWIPMENAYFSAFSIFETCNIVLQST